MFYLLKKKKNSTTWEGNGRFAVDRKRNDRKNVSVEWSPFEDET